MIYLSNYILYSGVKTKLHVFSNNLASLPQILLKKIPESLDEHAFDALLLLISARFPFWKSVTIVHVTSQNVMTTTLSTTMGCR